MLIEIGRISATFSSDAAGTSRAPSAATVSRNDALKSGVMCRGCGGSPLAFGAALAVAGLGEFDETVHGGFVLEDCEEEPKSRCVGGLMWQ